MQSIRSFVSVLAGVAPTLAQNFAPLQAFTATQSGLAAIYSVAGDLDHDGRVDLVVADGEYVNVLRGDGSGGFLPRLTVRAGYFASETRLADLNGDGHLDAEVDTLGGVSLVFGDGTGSLVAVGAVAGTLYGVAVADVDHDRDPDLLVGGAAGLIVYRNNGSGGFSAGVVTPVVAINSRVLGAGDFDDDGHVDALLHVDLGRRVVILYGDGAGGFQALTSVPVPSLGGAVAVGDLNGDGTPDFCIAGAQSNSVTLLLSQGPRAYAMPVVHPTPGQPLDAAIADIDADGRLDVILSASGQTWVLPGDGVGNLGAVRSFPGGGGLLAVTDLDGDGLLDVCTKGSATGQIGVLRNVTPTPAGLLPLGVGTPTCLGTIGITGNRRPAVGTADFRILNTNVPRRQTGFVAFGVEDPSGTDPLGLGFRVHLQFGSIVAVARVTSDAGGTASYPLAIPPNPALPGVQIAAQTYWAGDAGTGNTCSPAAFEIASSRALRIIVQP